MGAPKNVIRHDEIDASRFRLTPSERLMLKELKAALPKAPTPPAYRKVRFGTVTIRQYDQTLGDHPNCSIGPPVTLDWTYQQQEERPSVDEYATKINHPVQPLSFYRRMEILEGGGFTEKELKRASNQVTWVDFQRKVSRTLSRVWKVEYALECAARKTKEIVVGPKL